jgi:hypothetical protein
MTESKKIMDVGDEEQRKTKQKEGLLAEIESRGGEKSDAGRITSDEPHRGFSRPNRGEKEGIGFVGRRCISSPDYFSVSPRRLSSLSFLETSVQTCFSVLFSVDSLCLFLSS